MSNPLRNLPAVNELLESPEVQSILAQYSHERVVDALRSELDDIRQRLRAGEAFDPQTAQTVILQQATDRLSTQMQPKFKPVINATGILLHTNLGRAPIAESAAQSAYEAAHGYLNLEIDLESGKRSSRQAVVRDWICQLTGAESATVVNNNAAATVIALRALAAGKEVILSRGELVEIGGSFRIPDIMKVSGAILKEVGTTNITRIADYEKAITEQTAALMRVHRSNYRIVGHTQSATLEELVQLARQHQLWVVDDIGSGSLIDFRKWGLQDEPLASESIKAGADLVLFSGDKLLGGPQAGILAGRKELIQMIEKDPLMRAFRLDKMTLAALEATFRIYLNMDHALQEIPLLRMLETSTDALKQRAEQIANQLKSQAGIESVTIREDHTYVGGGSLPDQQLDTVVVVVQAANLSEEELAYQLRTGTPAIIPRVQAEEVLFDLRSIFSEQDQQIVQSVMRICSMG